MARFLGVYTDEPDKIDVTVVKDAKEAAMMGYPAALPHKPKPRRFPSPMDNVRWRNNF